MKKRFFIISVFSIIISLLMISYTFAANTLNDVTSGIRNMVGGAENIVENAGNTLTSGVRNGMNTLGQGMENTSNMTRNTVGGMFTDNDNNGDYTATRTATGTTGTDYSSWSWIIIGITAVGIGVLIWSYFTQNNRNHSYINSNNDR